MVEQSLLNFGFTNEYVTLRCRLCDSPVYKYGYALLWKDKPEWKVTLKYGWCRKYTHGVSVSKVVN